jgi:hypothetical protein
VRRTFVRAFTAVAAIAAVVATPSIAFAHEERPAAFPAGTGNVPTYRPYDATKVNDYLVVCTPESSAKIDAMSPGALRDENQALYAHCGYHSIQDAVNAVRQTGTNIYVLPGTYPEDDYTKPPTGDCASLQPASSSTGPMAIGTLSDPTAQAASENGVPVAISYDDQYRCPHNLNLIAILGHNPANPGMDCDTAVCDLQIEGTGASPLDVVIDNKFHKLNGIRGDRAGGLYLRNFTVQQSEFNSIYVMETDGAVIDHTVTRANDEYGILVFASDHVLISDCEAYYNGDSGIYPGGEADVNRDSTQNANTFDTSKTHGTNRFALEIRGCNSHHNTLGYSGTAGNSVWAHDNDFHDNTVGIATDSMFPGHPGMPQDHSRWSDNRIYNNNQNYYTKYIDTGVCDKPIAERGYMDGVVCPTVPLPVGTGLVIAGGNYDSLDHNDIWNNWRYAAMQLWIPSPLRGDNDPKDLYDTSNNNQYVDNRLGHGPGAPGTTYQPNGTDFWWDGEGGGNCWQDNAPPRPGDSVTSNFDPIPLPSCSQGGSVFTPGQTVRDTPFLSCVQYNRSDPTWRHPPGCTWFDSPSKPAGSQAPDQPSTPTAANHVGFSWPVGGGPTSGGLAGIGVALLVAAWLRRRRSVAVAA